jgi:hypothetical protein
MIFMESSGSCCPTETYEKFKECSESIIRRFIDDLQNKSSKYLRVFLNQIV